MHLITIAYIEFTNKITKVVMLLAYAGLIIEIRIMHPKCIYEVNDN